MHNGVATVFPLVLQFLPSGENDCARHASLRFFDLPAPHSVWTFYFLLLLNIDEELVFVSHSICYHTSMRSFHEDALLHNCES